LAENGGMADEQILTARWIFPVAGPPLQRGLVAIRGDRISAVEAHGSRTPDIDLGNSAIIPGLVNAHCHLDLSGLRGKVPPGPDFIGWLKQIIAHRRTQTSEQIEADIRDGLAEALRFGTTLIGDIAAGGSSRSTLSQAPMWSIAFREIIGLPSKRVTEVWGAADSWLKNAPGSYICRTGLSPHAPYSVNWSILLMAFESHVPVAVHLAETRAEVELLESKSGPFVSFLKELDAWDADGLAPSVNAILKQAANKGAVLFAHGNYLAPQAPVAPNSTIVYCPRTHSRFGHSPHNFNMFQRHGIRVALGTDSLASNPDLDVLAEARHMHACYPAFSGEKILRMATLSGAEALGWADQTGSLEPGKSADLVVVTLPDVASNDLYALLFEGSNSSGKLRRTMWRGQWRDHGIGIMEHSA
jgi:cytosine/adenosine deaminase-related metal-dependent hydrolase